jgi:hypothetical protein
MHRFILLAVLLAGCPAEPDYLTRLPDCASCGPGEVRHGFASNALLDWFLRTPEDGLIVDYAGDVRDYDANIAFVRPLEAPILTPLAATSDAVFLAGTVLDGPQHVPTNIVVAQGRDGAPRAA